MVALDTLAYVRRLESAGVPRAQAEAHADAFAAFAADELATKRDLLEVEARLRSEIRELDIRLSGRMEQLEGRMTIKLGGMLVAAVGLVAVLVKLF
jgi:hypothetical protein